MDNRGRIALRAELSQSGERTSCINNLLRKSVYDIPADDIDVEELADSVGVAKDDVRAYADNLRGGRSGILVTLGGDGDIDAEQLVKKVEEYLARDE